jgi:drug efflux transport system permease protein
MLQRIRSLIVKEFIQLRRDRRSMAMVILIPIIEICIFGYAFSTDITDVSLVIWDADNSARSRELIANFDNTEFFEVKYYALDYDDITKRIDSGDARAALVIPPDYARHIYNGEESPVQFFVDGSEPNAAVQAIANANLIVQAEGASLTRELSGSETAMMPLSLQSRVWYNPAMESSLFYLPGLIGVILQMMTSMLAAFAIVRERETGTIEQLNVTPLRRGELIVAKLIPNVIIGYGQVILILAAAVVVFGMPVHGNVFLFLGLTAFFLMFTLGIGLFISTVSHTQFQAMQLSMMALLPNILLSGFIVPVESMPIFARWVAAVLPLTYYLRITRGIIVKGIGIEYLWSETLILAVMGILTLWLAASRVRQTME